MTNYTVCTQQNHETILEENAQSCLRVIIPSNTNKN
jgi:hypothetical protein